MKFLSGEKKDKEASDVPMSCVMLRGNGEEGLSLAHPHPRRGIDKSLLPNYCYVESVCFFCVFFSK